MSEIEFNTSIRFDSNDTPDTIGKMLETLVPINRNKSHIYDYTPNYLLLNVDLGGCYHFKFNENGKLQTIRLHIMDIKKYKLHRLTLWKRHWWT